jgi:hypothetical protein
MYLIVQRVEIRLRRLSLRPHHSPTAGLKALNKDHENGQSLNLPSRLHIQPWHDKQYGCMGDVCISENRLRSIC